MAATKLILRDSKGEISQIVEADSRDPLVRRISELEAENTKLQGRLTEELAVSEQARLREVAYHKTESETLRQRLVEAAQREQRHRDWCANLGPEITKKVNVEIAKIVEAAVSPYRVRVALLEGERAIREGERAIRDTEGESRIAGYKQTISRLESQIADLTMPVDPYPPPRRRRRPVVDVQRVAKIWEALA